MSAADSHSDWVREYDLNDPDLQQADPMTKDARKQAARQIIDRNRVNVLFGFNDVAQLNSLLGTNFTGFVKRVNPKYPNDPRHLYAITSMEAFSWNEAISPSAELTRIKKVMRNTTQDLLSEFLEALNEPKCSCCGGIFDLTADHTPPFDVIAMQFIEAHGKPKTTASANGVGDVFADINIEAAWIAYHQSHTTLSVLCRPCNSSKGVHGKCRLDHDTVR